VPLQDDARRGLAVLQHHLAGEVHHVVVDVVLLLAVRVGPCGHHLVADAQQELAQAVAAHARQRGHVGHGPLRLVVRHGVERRRDGAAGVVRHDGVLHNRGALLV